jgi:two-component system, sensor histidine kinase and response regulator
MNNYESGQNTANILIVDDIPANLKVLGDILKNEGFRVRPVPSGKLALQVIEKEKPDLILLDIMMPEMDGYEVCRHIKANHQFSEIPIIFISALNETGDVVKALKAGGVDYVTKPFQAEEVLARVHTHIKLYRQSIELKMINLTKDKFFSIIAHDLRGPMGGFAGMTELLVEHMQHMTMDEIQENLGLLRDSSNNLFQLLENLLQWARLQQHEISYNPGTLNLQSIANENVKLIEEFAKHKGIKITMDIPGKLNVYADKNMLQTILRNHISNALKFTPVGGNVLLTANAPDDKYVEISVSDSGIGMTQEMIDSLFSLNSQNGRPGTGGEPSTGLGLLLCKEFVEKHGGTIRVESEIDKGSRFRFTVPMTI